MTGIKHLAEGVTLYLGDCREFIKSLPDNSVDAVPCDPPYELNFMGKGWDDTGIANDVTFWREVFRVLKPGGHLAAFSASRTYHRMACAIEDAGFEIRDSLMWLYGTGFPKSQNVSAFIDKMAGAERPVVRYDRAHNGALGRMNDDAWQPRVGPTPITAPVTPAAIEFDGFGTALKPAFEPIVLARKPLSEPTVAANVLKWRTGALNIDGCRIEAPEGKTTGGRGASKGPVGWQPSTGFDIADGLGRWPANVVTDGSDEVVGMFPSTHGAGHARKGKFGGEYDATSYNLSGAREMGRFGDSGNVARFFYSAKASKQDRNGSKHPTVKPIALMQWLARLITPPGGTVLDPFAGSGTTGAAAMLEGFKCILMEREAEYQQDIIRRIQAAKEEQEEKQEQPTLFSVAPAPPPKQEVML